MTDNMAYTGAFPLKPELVDGNIVFHVGTPPLMDITLGPDAVRELIAQVEDLLQGGQSTNAQVAARLRRIGYTAQVERLGVNVVGVSVVTVRGNRWVMSYDEMWSMGRDDGDDSRLDQDEKWIHPRPDVPLDELVDWASRVMGRGR